MSSPALLSVSLSLFLSLTTCSICKIHCVTLTLSAACYSSLTWLLAIVFLFFPLAFHCVYNHLVSIMAAMSVLKYVNWIALFWKKRSAGVVYNSPSPWLFIDLFAPLFIFLKYGNYLVNISQAYAHESDLLWGGGINPKETFPNKDIWCFAAGTCVKW